MRRPQSPLGVVVRRPEAALRPPFRHPFPWNYNTHHAPRAGPTAPQPPPYAAHAQLAATRRGGGSPRMRAAGELAPLLRRPCGPEPGLGPGLGPGWAPQAEPQRRRAGPRRSVPAGGAPLPPVTPLRKPLPGLGGG